MAQSVAFSPLSLLQLHFRFAAAPIFDNSSPPGRAFVLFSPVCCAESVPPSPSLSRSPADNKRLHLPYNTFQLNPFHLSTWKCHLSVTYGGKWRLIRGECRGGSVCVSCVNLRRCVLAALKGLQLIDGWSGGGTTQEIDGVSGREE